MSEAGPFTLDRFEPLVGSRFMLWLDDETGLPAQLIEVRAAPGSRCGFSLTFEGPPEPALPQHIYRLQHPQLDALDLFLVPVGRAAAGLHYEAVFG